MGQQDGSNNNSSGGLNTQLPTSNSLYAPLDTLEQGASHGNPNDQMALAMMNAHGGQLTGDINSFANAQQQAQLMPGMEAAQLTNVGQQYQGKMADFGYQQTGLNQSLANTQGQNSLYWNPQGIFQQQALSNAQRAKMAQFNLMSQDTAAGNIGSHGHQVREQNLGVQNQLATEGFNTGVQKQQLGYNYALQGNALAGQQLQNSQNMATNQYNADSSYQGLQGLSATEQAQNAPYLAFGQYQGDLMNSLAPSSYIAGGKLNSVAPNSNYNSLFGNVNGAGN